MDTVDDFMSPIDQLAPSRVVFGRVAYGPGGRFGPRRQLDVQLIAVDSGTMRVTTDGVPVDVGPGEAVCQWPGSEESYGFDPAGPTTHRWVALRPGPAGVPEALRRRDPGVKKESAALRAIDRAARALPRVEQGRADPARVHLGLACLAAFLDAEHPTMHVGDAGRSLPPPLVAMRALIVSDHHRPLKLADLAAAAAVTASHLVRLCRRELSTTPMKLLQDVRIDEAAVLLRHTGLSVKEVADQVGFADPFHFSRAFKQRRGASPRDYRRRVQGLAP